MEQAAQGDGADRFFTIGDMARTYNVTLRALRFYEDRGLIKPIRQGVSRFYDCATRARFETILRGKKLGFTLTQIRAMLPATGAEEAAPQLALQETQILNQIVQLERRREELNTAIVELRDAHMRMRDGAAATVAA